MILGKLQRAHPTLRGHFAFAYLVGSNELRAYLFLIYASHGQFLTIFGKAESFKITRNFKFFSHKILPPSKKYRHLLK